MRRLTLAIDLDGCGYDFVSALRDWCVRSKRLSRDQAVEVTCWEFWTQWGMTVDEWKDACRSGVDAGEIFWEGEPVEGFVEAMAELRGAGHRIHFVTNRSFGMSSAAATECWLKGRGVHYDGLTFTADKGAVRADVLIDDYPPNCEAFRRTGGLPLLFDRPWNEGADVERVHTWPEVVRVVEGIARGLDRPAVAGLEALA